MYFSSTVKYDRLTLMGLLYIWALPVLFGALVSVGWLAEGRRNMDTVNATENPSHGPQTRKNGQAEGVVKSVHSGSDGGPCRRTNCGRGRQCVLLQATGRAECVCEEKCRLTFVPVCGSDGRFYENHCEVYRTACMQKRRIYVVHSKDCFFKGDTCTMAEYNKLKTMLLDMQPKILDGRVQNIKRNMDQKRALVGTMFKYLDMNRDGYLDSDELTKISIKEHLENSLLECTMQDLLRYDDYNNDGHLTLHEFYTAFRSFYQTKVRIRPDKSHSGCEAIQ